MARILIVDDEPNILRVFSQILQDEGHETFTIDKGAEVINIIEKNFIDLVFLDVWLPDIGGLEILVKINKKFNNTAVVMISGHGSIDIAVQSTKKGAYDFLEKPPSMERIVTVTNNALESSRLRQENIKLREAISKEDEMIGNSEKMNEIKDIIERAAATNARVFITGNNGTGKELVARAIYRRSQRSDKAFIKVNCAAIPDELIESELFGHEKGSFTGALNRRKGKFELANQGTLFLDEVCNMSLAAQAKVLRVLQEQQFERVGGNETITVDVSVIAATNVDIKQVIDDNLFREDLYYRLNVIPIKVSSLSERREDIPLFVEYYIQKFSIEHGVGHKNISDKALEFLKNYSWPGNIRQLKNIIERLCIMVNSKIINESDLKSYLTSSDEYAHGITVNEKSDLKKAKEEFEKKYIINALEKNEGNVTSTAKELGIERTNLHRKIKQYNINIDRL